MADVKDSALCFSDGVLKEMLNFRFSAQLCDIRFTTQHHEQSFVAHRLVLAASSAYFRQLFESKQGADPVTCVKDVDSDILEMLINFCYTGLIDVNEQNVRKLLNAATVLQLSQVINVCADFLRKQMHDNESWLNVLQIADEVKLKSLREDALNYAIVNFFQISQNAEFLDMSVELLETLIESDELGVPTEQETFYAIKRWYEHDEMARRASVAKLITSLRVAQLDTAFILQHIRPLPDCIPFTLNALDWIHVNANRSSDSLRHTKARRMHSTLIAIPIASSSIESILQYDYERDKWDEIAKLNLRRYYFAVGAYLSKLIFLGGAFYRDKKTTNYVGSYDLATGKWQKLASMQKCRYEMCVAQLAEHIYVIGGEDESNEILSSVERFNINTGKWCAVSSMHYKRKEAVAAVLDDKIYVLGGEHGVLGALRTTECYNPETNTWNQLADMHEARTLHGAVAAHNKIFVMGGWDSKHVFKSAECYDPLKNEWTKIGSLNEGRQQVCGVFFNNRLLALGGVSEINEADDWTDTVEEYDFEQNLWIKRNGLVRGNEFNCVAIPTCLRKNLKGVTIRGA